ncbi:hypothetical protein AAW14_19825 [Streptomyces hygroscopicus]|nr:hypothetical protein [Streptomyces hygroscopicus]
MVGAITPFNFPLNLAINKIAPALAAGNTVVHNTSKARATVIGLPTLRDSSRASSSARSSIASAIRSSTRPRCGRVSPPHSSLSNAACATETAWSRSAFEPQATRQITSSVAGFMISRVSPLSEGRGFPSMKSCPSAKFRAGEDMTALLSRIR